MTRIRFTLDPHASDEENYATIVAIAEKYGCTSCGGATDRTQDPSPLSPGSASEVVPADASLTVDRLRGTPEVLDVDE